MSDWLRRLRCWYWGHPDVAYDMRYCPKCGVDMESPAARTGHNR